MESKTKRTYELHGMTKTPEYHTWLQMKHRCLYPKHKSYNYYGGRGITVDPKWINSFLSFYTDMGARPKGMTLERKNNNGDYTPDNCCWASRRRQMRNQRASYINTSGVRGVYWQKSAKKWQVLIRTNNKRLHLGYFTNFQKAKAVRLAAEALYWDSYQPGSNKRITGTGDCEHGT